MILASNLVGFGRSGPRVQSIYDLIVSAGLDSNLTCVYDAGVKASWDTGDTKWKDLTSNGHNFFLGNDGTTSNDPSHQGTPGGASNAEYWDGFNAAYFRFDSSNPTAFENIHKNNAAFTLMAIFRFQDPGANNTALCGTQGATGSDEGFRWAFLGDTKPTFSVGNGTGSALSVTASSGLTDNTDYILFLSYDEAAASGFQRANKSSIHTISSSYSSPTTNPATYAMEIMKPGNADLNSWASDARLYAFAIWSTNLSTSNCDTLHDDINTARSYV